MAKKKSKGNLSAFVLIDRSGSMGGTKWTNAIESVNGYVQGLKEQGIEGDVTVAVFDSNWQQGLNQQVPVWPPGLNNLNNLNREVPTFDILRESQSVEGFRPLLVTEATPRGGTPLYDSAAKLIDLAERRGSARTVLIMMTDGDENTSREYTLSRIKSRFEQCKARGWEILFLGAEFNVERYAAEYGLETSKFINSSVRNMGASMNYMSGATAAYAATGKSVQFDTAVKAQLSEGTV